MTYNERPLDMLLRQLEANRAAIRYRNPQTGRRHFCHLPEYRSAYVTDCLQLRAAIRSRNAQ